MVLTCPTQKTSRPHSAAMVIPHTTTRQRSSCGTPSATTWRREEVMGVRGIEGEEVMGVRGIEGGMGGREKGGEIGMEK